MNRPAWLAEIRGVLFLGATAAALCLFPRTVNGQNLNLRDRITQPVDESARTRWQGSRHKLARPEFDAGRVAPETRMERVVLLLQPAAAQEKELEDLLAAQHDSSSPWFHQ